MTATQLGVPRLVAETMVGAVTSASTLKVALVLAATVALTVLETTTKKVAPLSAAVTLFNLRVGLVSPASNSSFLYHWRVTKS